jgi:hypothetical protein
VGTTLEDGMLLWNGAEGVVEVGAFFQRFLDSLHGSVCMSVVKILDNQEHVLVPKR